MRPPKRRFYTAFAATVICLAVAQGLFHFKTPPLPEPQAKAAEEPPPPAEIPAEEEVAAAATDSLTTDSLGIDSFAVDSLTADSLAASSLVVDTAPLAVPRPARVRPLRRGSKVWSYPACFPDIQDVQIVSAMANGITPAASPNDLEALLHSRRLVCIYGSPFYAVEPLTHSLPYVVPKMQQLLNTIGILFLDSCLAKGLPPHLPVVTSVLRTNEQVARLQRGNSNATTNSCHLYGTTVDIAYTRFVPVRGTPPEEPTRWDDDLKFVLAEVLYDLRLAGCCYIKYEHKQACFHLTVR